MPRISVVDRLTVWRERPLAAFAVVLLAILACVASVVAAPGMPGYLGAGLALIAIAAGLVLFIWPDLLPLGGDTVLLLGFGAGICYAGQVITVP